MPYAKKAVLLVFSATDFSGVAHITRRMRAAMSSTNAGVSGAALLCSTEDDAWSGLNSVTLRTFPCQVGYLQNAL